MSNSQWNSDQAIGDRALREDAECCRKCRAGKSSQFSAKYGEGRRVMHEYQPNTIEGVPYCEKDDTCPQYDGKRCRAMGCRPSSICEPSVRVMRAEVERLRAAIEWLHRSADCARSEATRNSDSSALTIISNTWAAACILVDDVLAEGKGGE